MKWFKPKRSLGGWHHTQAASLRRAKAISSRPKNMSLNTKRLSTGRALQALANVTRSRETKKAAKKDAEYFFSKLKGR